MKRIVHSIVIALTLGSMTAAEADYQSFVSALKCPRSFQMWANELAATEGDARAFAASLGKDQADAGIDAKKRDVMFITLLWPSMLADKVGYWRLYDDCAALHWNLVRAPTKEANEAWKSCVAAGYSRDKPPEIFQFLRACYDRLARQ